MRHFMKSVTTSISQLRKSSHHLYRSWRSLSDSQEMNLCSLNPHSHLCTLRRTCSSTHIKGYRENSRFTSVGDSAKFFSPLQSLQPKAHKLLGFESKNQQHRCFQASSSPRSQHKIVQNNKCCRLEITFGMSTLTVPFVWLRDHCRSEKYYNHRTFQKNADPDLLKSDLMPAYVGYTDDKLGVVITWKDGHISKFTFEFLADNFYPGRLNSRTQRLLWDKTVIESECLPAVMYNDHMTTELGLRHSLTNLVKYGFTLVEEAPVSVEGIRAVVERISFVEDTIFGGMWTLTSDSSRGDTAYSSQRLGAHTDNTYMHTPAGIQVFQCLEHIGSGGETLLVDGFYAMDLLHISEPLAFQMLSKTVVPHEYKETASGASPGYHLYSLGTVISTHPASGELLQIRYNPYDRAPLNTVRPDYIQTFYEAYDKLSRIITSPSLELWVKLRPGQVLLIDNWRVLHGRAEFDGKRVLGGCYLPRDVWTSKARLIGAL